MQQSVVLRLRPAAAVAAVGPWLEDSRRLRSTSGPRSLGATSFRPTCMLESLIARSWGVWDRFSAGGALRMGRLPVHLDTSITPPGIPMIGVRYFATRLAQVAFLQLRLVVYNVIGTLVSDPTRLFRMVAHTWCWE